MGLTGGIPTLKLMVKKIIITVIVVALVAVGSWFGFQHFQQEIIPPSTTIQAVPSDAAFIFESKDTHGAWKKLSETNVMWEELKTTEYFAEANKLGNYMDSLFQNNSTLKQLTDKRSVVISAHMSGANNFDFLYCISLPTNTNEETIAKMIDELSSKKALVSSRNYDETPITEVIFQEQDLKFSYAVKNGIFLSSVSPVLIEKSIRNLNSNELLTNDHGFVKVQRTAGFEEIDGNLYLNFNALPHVLATCLNTETKLQALPLQAFATWAEMDVKLNPNGLNMSGFTYSNDTTNNFLNIFLNQQPQDIDLVSVAPANTAVLLFYGLSDFNTYYTDYRTYLERNNRLFEYDRDLEKANNECGCKMADGINSWIGNEMALIITEPSNEDLTQHTYAVFHANNIDNAQTKLELLVSQITEKTGEANEIEMYSDHVLRQLRFGNGMYQLLGGPFKGLDSPYYTSIGDYIVMANSKNALRSLINSYNDQKVLSRDMNYIAFADELASEANLFLYSNIARSPNIYKQYLTPEYADDVEKHLELYRKFEAVALQVGTYKDNLFLNNMYLKYNPVYKQETSSLWETMLDTSITSRPQLVLNHTNQTRDVIVQDNNNMLYLISSTGTVLWQRQLDEKIRGKIHQIDIYSNEKLQFLFGTRNKIYVLDRLGRDVTGWPVALPAPASNNVVVMDYDKTRNYRILIACVDNQLYNYDKTGQRVEGWQFTGAPARIVTDVQHFVQNNKDYIFAADLAGNIHLLDRRGQVRYESPAKITGRSRNPISIELGSDINSTKVVYSDTLGNVVKIQLSGNIERINLGSYSASHYFTFADIDDDQRAEYILLDNNKLLVFATDKQEIFTHTFDSTITVAPIILNAEVMKIGIASEKTNEVFLFNQVGDLSEGLPLYGSTLMDIGDMNRTEVYNMVCGSKDGHIYTYTLK